MFTPGGEYNLISCCFLTKRFVFWIPLWFWNWVTDFLIWDLIWRVWFNFRQNLCWSWIGSKLFDLWVLCCCELGFELQVRVISNGYKWANNKIPTKPFSSAKCQIFPGNMQSCFYHLSIFLYMQIFHVTNHMIGQR